jgi:hypothetical protein
VVVVPEEAARTGEFRQLTKVAQVVLVAAVFVGDEELVVAVAIWMTGGRRRSTSLDLHGVKVLRRRLDRDLTGRLLFDIVVRRLGHWLRGAWLTFRYGLAYGLRIQLLAFTLIIVITLSKYLDLKLNIIGLTY